MVADCTLDTRKGSEVKMEYSNETLIYMNEKVQINFEYLYAYDKYLRFVLNIKTEMFMGSQEFYLYIGDVSDLIESLKQASETLMGNITFNDSESESYMTLSLDGYNNIMLCGEIGNIFDDIHMKFNIKVDQTCVKLMEEILVKAMIFSKEDV